MCASTVARRRRGSGRPSRRAACPGWPRCASDNSITVSSLCAVRVRAAYRRVPHTRGERSLAVHPVCRSARPCRRGGRHRRADQGATSIPDRGGVHIAVPDASAVGHARQSDSPAPGSGCVRRLMDRAQPTRDRQVHSRQASRQVRRHRYDPGVRRHPPHRLSDHSACVLRFERERVHSGRPSACPRRYHSVPDHPPHRGVPYRLRRSDHSPMAVAPTRFDRPDVTGRMRGGSTPPRCTGSGT